MSILSTIEVISNLKVGQVAELISNKEAVEPCEKYIRRKDDSIMWMEREDGGALWDFSINRNALNYKWRIVK